MDLSTLLVCSTKDALPSLRIGFEKYIQILILFEFLITESETICDFSKLDES